MLVNQSNSQKFFYGAALAGLWLSGLFLVLELDLPAAKALILLSMAPLSIQLDKLVTHLMRPRTLAPARLRQKSVRAFMPAGCNRARACGLHNQPADERLVA